MVVAQISILMVQNTSDRVVYFNAHFMSATGVLLGTYSQNLAPHGSQVLNWAKGPGVG